MTAASEAPILLQLSPELIGGGPAHPPTHPFTHPFTRPPRRKVGQLDVKVLAPLGRPWSWCLNPVNWAYHRIASTNQSQSQHSHSTVTVTVTAQSQQSQRVNWAYHRIANKDRHSNQHGHHRKYQTTREPGMAITNPVRNGPKSVRNQEKWSKKRRNCRAQKHRARRALCALGDVDAGSTLKRWRSQVLE